MTFYCFFIHSRTRCCLPAYSCWLEDFVCYLFNALHTQRDTEQPRSLSSTHTHTHISILYTHLRMQNRIHTADGQTHTTATHTSRLFQTHVQTGHTHTHTMGTLVGIIISLLTKPQVTFSCFPLSFPQYGNLMLLYCNLIQKDTFWHPTNQYIDTHILTNICKTHTHTRGRQHMFK